MNNFRIWNESSRELLTIDGAGSTVHQEMFMLVVLLIRAIFGLHILSIQAEWMSGLGLSRLYGI